MASLIFKRIDRRYFATALANSLTHGELDVFESGLELKTEGNKGQRATAIVRHLFEDLEHSDFAIIDLLNHLYVEGSTADFLVDGNDFKQLKSKVLDPRGVVAGDDGYLIEGAETVRTDRTGLEHDLKLVGQGSFALVYKYRDEEYLIPIAVKQALRSSSELELQRFKSEFDVVKGLKPPIRSVGLPVRPRTPPIHHGVLRYHPG